MNPLFPHLLCGDSSLYAMIGAFFAAGGVAALLAGRMIRNAQLFASAVRPYTPDTHQIKHNTPTMGGVSICAAVLSVVLFCGGYRSPLLWLLWSTLVGFGAIGLADDYGKIRRKKGISERAKFLAQGLVASSVLLEWHLLWGLPNTLFIPLVGLETVPYGQILFVPWALFIMIGVSNAVNLTDGLDGLASSSLILCYVTLTGIAFMAGFTELALYGAALSGATIGFLWYNAYPARLFMGDVGSLALGGVLAAMALLLRVELLLPLMAGLFMVETLSVMIQVAHYKRHKRGIFKMAPLHHHFELLGMHEATITTRATILTALGCLLSVALLMLC